MLLSVWQCYWYFNISIFLSSRLNNENIPLARMAGITRVYETHGTRYCRGFISLPRIYL